MGLERSALIDLNKKMFNLEKSEFKIGNRIIPLPTKITFLVSELIRDNTKKGIKGSHLFYTYYLKKYNVMTENSINKVFERIKNIDLSNEKWTVFSPQYIRSCLIKLLFENNYTIEDISYLTGMDLTNISKHITFEEICNKVNLSNNNPKLAKHPFAKFLNS